MFQGENISVLSLKDGLVELCFDRRDAAINKLDARTIDEFRQATECIAASPAVRGVLVTSAKDVFIVGADITEFSTLFQMPAKAIAKTVRTNDERVTAFEELQIPSVVAINGFALGGGLELAMLGSLRVMAASAQVGLPEVNLGLIPGLGGTARLSRLAGLATAIDWVVTGKTVNAPTALAAGVVDHVLPLASLREGALSLLQRAVLGHIDWQAAQHCKRVRLPLTSREAADIVDAARSRVVPEEDKRRPAAGIVIDMMTEAAVRDRAGALDLEAAAFGRVARTQAAASLVQIFLNEQSLKKLFKRHVQAARPVKQAVVLGAGIMGGGIAYASAQHGIPVRMKDIAQAQLDLGMDEARKQLAKLVRNGRLEQKKADAVLASITPQFDDTGLDSADYVVEAVVENLDVKRNVLAALERTVKKDTVLASNTSSLRIDDIAQSLAHPENFVGMHFFNPVPAMKLVEVIRGTKTNEAAVSTAVGYAVALGKTPIVVSDCPGFLVNRVLMPYINAFLRLLADGADFENIDRVMEAFGWPMGPAYLHDVIGMDVLSHVDDVIRAGYQQRMPRVECNALKLMVRNHRYGQKSGAGFYRYEHTPMGRPLKHSSAEALALVATLQPRGVYDFSDDKIVERMMVPMIVEAARALEEQVVATPAELDMALMLGLGFPAHAGGALKYADWLGLGHVVQLCDSYANLGAPYAATPRMRAMAGYGERYYPV
ncbi:fatty acid oxidation complex subunit alpha FadB [Paraburkholderia sediminicola]|uniref:fatty acid oxidation complex subunit alpha FadB n=1 Tax=Paraburkholderia sediminicola TaxID=458836 RepID=UPI0038BD5DD3